MTEELDQAPGNERDLELDAGYRLSLVGAGLQNLVVLRNGAKDHLTSEHVTVGVGVLQVWFIRAKFV